MAAELDWESYDSEDILNPIASYRSSPYDAKEYSKKAHNAFMRSEGDTVAPAKLSSEALGKLPACVMPDVCFNCAGNTYTANQCSAPRASTIGALLAVLLPVACMHEH